MTSPPPSSPLRTAPLRTAPLRTAPLRLLRGLVLAPIRLYSRLISPALPRRCKYEPTCSRYAEQAIQEFGILRGLVLAGWRVLRCNPWSLGGYDPPHDQHLFATRPTAPPRA